MGYASRMIMIFIKHFAPCSEFLKGTSSIIRAIITSIQPLLTVYYIIYKVLCYFTRVKIIHQLGFTKVSWNAIETWILMVGSRDSRNHKRKSVLCSHPMNMGWTLTKCYVSRILGDDHCYWRSFFSGFGLLTSSPASQRSWTLNCSFLFRALIELCSCLLVSLQFDLCSLVLLCAASPEPSKPLLQI